MLQAIRDRAQGVFAWVMLIVVGVPFALWGIQNYLDTDKEAPVVTVGGKEIFERDVNREFEQNLANLVGLQQFDESWLKKESMERLVRAELMSQDAFRHGLQMSDESVREVIQALPYFQTDGRFDGEKFKLALTSRGISSPEYAADVRRSLILEQYQKGMLDTGFLAADAVDSFMKSRNQERQIEYVVIPKKVATGIPGDAEVEAYYKEHATEFQTPEKLAVTYVLLDRNQVAAGIKLTEEDLKAQYEEQLANYTTPERRRLSHILVAAEGDKPDQLAAAEKKIGEIKQRLDKGEDFAKLAKELSDDKISGAKGGDLGLLAKGGLDPNIVSSAVSLKNDEVSAPVKTPFGYHLVKVTELVPEAVKPFDAVRAEVEKAAQHAASESRYYELSQALAEQAFEHADTLENAVSAIKGTVQTTDYFTRTEGAGIAGEESFRKAAFAQEVLDGKNSEPVELSGGDKVAVLRQKDRIPAAAKPLADVKASIVTALQDRVARDEAQKQAQTLFEAAKSGRGLADIAKELKSSVTRSESFKRNDTKVKRPLVTAAFKLMATGVPASYSLVELENGDHAIVNLLAIKDGDASAIDKKELEAARDFLNKNAAQNEFAAYMAGLRAVGDVVERPAKPE